MHQILPIAVQANGEPAVTKRQLPRAFPYFQFPPFSGQPYPEEGKGRARCRSQVRLQVPRARLRPAPRDAPLRSFFATLQGCLPEKGCGCLPWRRAAPESVFPKQPRRLGLLRAPACIQPQPGLAESRRPKGLPAAWPLGSRVVCTGGAARSLLPFPKSGVRSPYAVGAGQVRAEGGLDASYFRPLGALPAAPASQTARLSRPERLSPAPSPLPSPPSARPGPAPPHERGLLASPSGGWRRPARGHDQPER